MKQTKFAILVLLSGLLSCQPEPQKNYLEHVNILIGTRLSSKEGITPRAGSRENFGQTIPAVTAPFGMTQWTPQIQETEVKCKAPFYYGSTKIQGFRATHWLDGSCTQDYGSFTFFPTDLARTVNFLPNPRATEYLMDNETASPAYLSTLFTDINLFSEVTATKRAGFFKFSWLDPVDASVIVDVNSDEGEGFIKIDTINQEIYGYNPVHRIYAGSGKPAGIAGYFVAKFNKKIIKHATFAGMDFNENTTERKNGESLGAWVSFGAEKDLVLLMKVGTSFTSIDNARQNLIAEIPDWDFNKTKANLEQDWNRRLAKIDVEGGSEQDYTKFYTALYRSMFHPRLVSDVNGDYPGFADDNNIHTADGFEYYDDFSNWDIYRAQMPLLSLIAPQEYNDMVKSLIAKAEQGGWLPVFPMWGNYTSAMIGDHSSSIIADAAMKGFDFDLEKAYHYMRKNAFEIPDDMEEYRDGKGRRALNTYMQFGYIPLEDEVPDAFHRREQVSRTLEYAYNDWALAQVAQKLGHDKDYNELMGRALNYQNVFDPAKGWMCGRYADGTFTDEFDATADMPYITEGTPKHYTFYVPHDVDGLMELMGGKEKFKQELDVLFANNEYWHGNEPSHQIPYFYNYTGDWQKTQSTVKHILETEYGTDTGGLSGNEDAGQMSAWYVFGAMGFYPVCPASLHYQLSSPIFDKVTLNLDKKYYAGEKLILETEPGNNYKSFEAVEFNGKRIEPVLLHEDIQKGGRLKFSMN